MDRRFSDRRQKDKHTISAIVRAYSLMLPTLCRDQRSQPFSARHGSFADRDDISVAGHALLNHFGNKFEQPWSEPNQVVGSLPSDGRIDHGCVWEIKTFRVQPDEQASQI